MDWGLYVLTDVLVIGLGLLSYQDRLFGVAGILVGFIVGAFIYNDNTTTGITFNSSYSQTGNAVLPYLIILVVLIILDIAIILHISAQNKQSVFNSSNE